MTYQPAIPVETVATYPFPGTKLPSNLQFSPDNQWLTYLDSHDGSLVNQLYRYNLDSGKTELLADAAQIGATEDNLSLEAKLQRERARLHALGITHYQFSKDGAILIPLPPGLFILDKPATPLRLLVSSEAGAIQNGRFSPNGEWVSYVQNSELHIVPTAGGEPRQLTFGAAEQGKTHGLAEYIAQEEMGRTWGYWWSPDSERIAFTEVDETHIPVYRIMHQGSDSVGAGAQEDHRYPFAGQPNAIVRLAVIGLEASEPVWMDLGADEDIYLARVSWAGNGRLLAQRLNREQSVLDLLLFNPEDGRSTLLLQERSDVWINLHNLLRTVQPSDLLPDGGFIWASERTGYRHLYLYDWDGREIRPLTSGNWLVDELVSFDVDENKLYFTATKATPTEKHLYITDFTGGEPQKLTQLAGVHSIMLNKKRQQYIDIASNSETPYTISLIDLQNNEATPLFAAKTDNLDALKLTTPQFVTLSADNGDTLYGTIYHPPAHFGSGPFPTVVSVYGGPHAQRVTNSWATTVDMRAQYLAQHGFLVFKLDNRGAARRGLAFEGHIKHDMGSVEVADQVTGVNWLVAQGLTDPARVGIYGWSYGGYMALMALAKAGDVFTTAVSGAPVTHWDGYDTCYTERYMGTPQTNPEGYKVSSVMHHAEKMTGNLMIIHGLIDENVHFRHTARLINALIKARKRYDLRLFPNERHSPRGLADRMFMEEQVRDYFLQHV